MLEGTIYRRMQSQHHHVTWSCTFN